MNIFNILHLNHCKDGFSTDSLSLSRDLENNTRGNLDAEQMECTRAIHRSSTDLLTLINEILNLSKIEPGRLSLRINQVSLAEVKSHLKENGRPNVHAFLPAALRTAIVGNGHRSGDS